MPGGPDTREAGAVLIRGRGGETATDRVSRGQDKAGAQTRDRYRCDRFLDLSFSPEDRIVVQRGGRACAQ